MVTLFSELEWFIFQIWKKIFEERKKMKKVTHTQSANIKKRFFIEKFTHSKNVFNIKKSRGWKQTNKQTNIECSKQIGLLSLRSKIPIKKWRLITFLKICLETNKKPVTVLVPIFFCSPDSQQGCRKSGGQSYPPLPQILAKIEAKPVPL